MKELPDGIGTQLLACVAGDGLADGVGKQDAPIVLDDEDGHGHGFHQGLKARLVLFQSLFRPRPGDEMAELHADIFQQLAVGGLLHRAMRGEKLKCAQALALPVLYGHRELHAVEHGTCLLYTSSGRPAAPCPA